MRKGVAIPSRNVGKVFFMEMVFELSLEPGGDVHQMLGRGG